MRYPGRIAIFSLLFLTSLVNADHGSYPYANQFRYWYPQSGTIFEQIKNDHCFDKYFTYLSRNQSIVNIDIIGGGDKYSVLTQPVIDCILNHTSDYIKNGMTSAQVLLGIMPTALALLGPSTVEMSMLANVARRPLLALTLSAESPSVYFSRAFEYSEPHKILALHKLRMRQWRPPNLSSELLISGAEYAIAVGALANIAVINWQLGVGTICAFWTDGIFAPTLWACLGIIVHILGTVVLRMRLCGWRGRGEAPGAFIKEFSPDNTRPPPSRATRIWEWIQGIPTRLSGIAKTEFIPSAAERFDMRIKEFVESKLFLFSAWALSMFTIFHVIFGTLLFASTTFIGTLDALVIIGRYTASAAACRIVLMYELPGLQDSDLSDGMQGKRGDLVTVRTHVTAPI
ncbi:hypothetical protein B0T14DRAFT_589169 [Immersiella caudata]|uniref:Gustatory receptor n=1 Tax=Immersiella caudata TaxID=314043 RepID=A0AA39WK62_9PEZI|nr:hypothetical protein B0T14DRAFT_589169 [Immersiella caudata]